MSLYPKKPETRVFVRGQDFVPIQIKDPAYSSQPGDILAKWRELLNILTEIEEVPAALIMRVLDGKIEVHASSENEANVYKEGASEELGCGLYCETVVGNLENLSVPNALEDPLWEHNPDVPLGMIAYYGVPLLWPDGSIFGTLCILDSKKNHFSEKIKRLMHSFRSAIEADLDHHDKQHELFHLQERVHRELEENVKRAELANLAKNEFLSDMSHELRTPLNPIIGLSELMIAEETDRQKRKALETIHESGTHLLSLISEILDFSKLERGEYTLEKTTFELNPFLAGIIEIMAPLAQSKGIVLKLEQAENLPKTIETDALRIRQLLINLINNALKFTEKGSVVLHSYYDNEGFHFAVSDTGIGIDPDKQKKIFEPFFQVRDSFLRQQSGTGLGLSICQKICKSLGASISLKSTTGKGSTFLVSLPDCTSQTPEKPI